jgi:tyrosine-protein kinase Etk/Wzc
MQSSISENKEQNESGNNLLISQLWFKYFPYWPLLVLLFAACVTGTWFYLRYTIPMYESSAVILVKDVKKGFDDSKMIESLDQLATKKIIENELEVLRAKSLMSEVVKKLHLYAPVSEEGKVVSHSAYATSPVRVEVINPDSLAEVSKVYFSFNPEVNKVIIKNQNYPLDAWVNTTYGTLRFVKISNNKPKRKLFFSLVDPKKITQGLVGALNVSSASKLSTIINLKIRDEVPKRGEDILNGLVSEYTEAAIDDKNALAENTLEFIEDRLNHLVRELDSIQHKIESYKSERGAIDISAQGRIFLQNVSDNDQKLGDINMQLAVLGEVKGYVMSKDKAGGIVPSTVGVNDPMMGQLLNQLYNLELEHKKLKNTTAENNPMLVSITEQINKIKPSILENVQSRMGSLEAARGNLRQTNGAYTSMLQSIPQKERKLIEISREESIKNNIYTFLLQKREEAALSSSSMVSDSRVVDEAESSLVPVSPNRKMYYAIAVIGALALFIGFVTAKEMLNLTILFRSEIEQFTNTPIVGEIMYEKSKLPLIATETKNTFVVEQFRRMRAALPHIGITGKRKKILVTSSIPGEGKSFVAANLALSLASTGKKVVLVEFDLSKPTLEEKLNQYQEKGVADYLKGGIEPEEIIKRTVLNENLFFISCGDLPSNPSELIMNKKVVDLLAYLNDIFDYVVIDSAPSGPSSDAYILSPMCDATLYVVRHKFTPKVFVQRLDANNKITYLKNIAIVFNGVHSRGFKNNNYGYGFGYGYEHNYAARQTRNEQRNALIRKQ